LGRLSSQIDLVGLSLLEIAVEHSIKESGAVAEKSLWQEVALEFYRDFDSGVIVEINESCLFRAQVVA